MTNQYKQTKNNLIRIAISGGPGVGKSTVLEMLAYKGYQTVPEAARIIIEREQLKDSDCLPWKNTQLFQNTISELQLKLEDSIQSGIVFSDRGLIDGYAYSKVDQIKTPEIILRKGKDRYNQVFLLAQLPNYQKDNSRREDIEKARILQEAIRLAYIEFGYTPIEVPVLSPEERVDFILSKLNSEVKTRLCCG